MNLANFVTLLRLAMAPLIIWALLIDQVVWAFAIFLIAGLSDAVDGIVARAFDQQSELGTLLDPIADKTLLVTVFIVLAYLGHIPLWLTILVVSRDVLIIAGILICFVMGKPPQIKPLWVSKANTVAQISLASLVLAALALPLDMPLVQAALVAITAVLTVASAVAYIIQGIQHLSQDTTASAVVTD